MTNCTANLKTAAAACLLAAAFIPHPGAAQKVELTPFIGGFLHLTDPRPGVSLRNAPAAGLRLERSYGSVAFRASGGWSRSEVSSSLGNADVDVTMISAGLSYALPFGEGVGMYALGEAGWKRYSVTGLNGGDQSDPMWAVGLGMTAALRSLRFRLEAGDYMSLYDPDFLARGEELLQHDLLVTAGLVVRVGGTSR